MSCLWLDGFDHYATVDVNEEYTTSSGFTIQAAGGRNGTNCGRLTGSGDNLTKTIPSTDVVGIGIAWKMGALTADFVVFREGATDHLEFTVTAAGNIECRRNAGGTLLGTSSGVAMSINTYYYIEIKVKINDSTGGVWIKIDGTDVLRLGDYAVSPAALDTRNGGTSGVIDNVDLRSGSGDTNDFDDYVIWDDAVADADNPNDDFLGDIRVETVFPTGSGNSTDGTPSAGSNWQCVDDNPPNDDTDYVSETTTGDHDTYAMGNLATATGSVTAVRWAANARKTDAGSCTVAPVLRTGGADFTGSDKSPGTSYRYLSQIYDVNPDTGLAFTISEINAIEVGWKKTG